ncbi:hypothetical protein C8F01DRAFT_1141192 [Mycena amicta]|nr:hypothetical protein C8F01DRAFT_1141192 [Mycena amicta]
MASESVECVAFDTVLEDECKCEDYDDNMGTCLNCDHKQRYHLQVPADVDVRVDDILNSFAPPKDKKKAKGKGKGKASTAGGGSSRWSSDRARLALGSASRESNKGLRPTTAPPAKSKNRIPKDNDSFRVCAVVVIAGGTKSQEPGPAARTITPGFASIPNNAVLTVMALQGLAKLDVVTGFSFGRSWSKDQVQEALGGNQGILPHIFQYFAAIEAEKNNGQPSWYLAGPAGHGKQLTLMASNCCDGATLYLAKGNTASQGFLHNRLFIVPRDPIPDHILQAWATPEAADFEQAAKDSDSDSDSDVPDSIAQHAGPSTLAGRKRPKRLRRISDAKDSEQPPAKHAKGFEGIRRWSRPMASPPAFVHGNDDDGAIMEGGSDEPITVDDLEPPFGLTPLPQQLIQHSGILMTSSRHIAVPSTERAHIPSMIPFRPVSTYQSTFSYLYHGRSPPGALIYPSSL